MNGIKFWKSITGKNSSTENENAKNRRQVAVIYLTKAKSELEDDLDSLGKDEQFEIKFDIECIDEAIKYLEK